MYKVLLSDKAEKDIYDIADYISEQLQNLLSAV